MAYTPGWNPDKQTRVAIAAQDQGNIHGPLPLISSGGLPTVTVFDFPNPNGLAVLQTTARHIARRAAFASEADTLLPDLLNKDVVYAGAGQVPSYEQQQALPSFAAVRAAAFIALRSNTPGEYGGILPQLNGKDSVAPGQSTYDTRRPVGFLRPPFRLALFEISTGNGILPENAPIALPVGQASLDTRLPQRRFARTPSIENAGYVDGTEFWLLRDAANPGEQSTDLAPRAPLRAATDTYSIADASEFWMLQDATTVGEQSTALAPVGAPRSRDYTYTDPSETWLFGTDAMVVGEQSTTLTPQAAARARDYSFVLGPPLELTTTIVAPVGAQVTNLPPAPAPRRIGDYTWLASLIPTLVGQDAVVVGEQLSGNAPAAARRASTLTDAGFNFTTVTNSTPPVIPQGQSTLSSEPTPRAAARARDYSIAASFPLPLIGKDALYGAAGQSPTYDWSYLPPKPRYLQGSGEPTQDLLNTLLQVIAAPVGESVLDLPVRGPARARDYSIAASFPLVLRGQDASNSGAQLSGNAPPGARRANDYTHTASFPLELIGRDAMAPGRQSTDLPPKAPQRARDYSHLGWFPLELRGQDAMAAGDQVFDLAPRKAARLVDYTHLQGYVAGTFPQEAIPTGAQVTILPPTGPQRAGKSTYSLGYFEPLTLVTPPRDLVYLIGPLQETWHAGLLLIPKWAIGAPKAEFWKVGTPTQ